MKKATTKGRSTRPPRRSVSTKHAARPTEVGITPIDPTEIAAKDIMRAEVAVLSADDPIPAAAELLEDSGAGGAAVIDGSGQLIGVLTKSDIARSDHLAENGVATRPGTRPSASLDGMVDEDGVDEEVYSTDEYDEEVLGRVRVADWMTHGVIQVAPEATLAAVCRRMLDEAIHRVFVVERDKLLGVIGADDIMRLLAEPPGRRAARALQRSRHSHST
jgi:CBS domain-containing protein